MQCNWTQQGVFWVGCDFILFACISVVQFLVSHWCSINKNGMSHIVVHTQKEFIVQFAQWEILTRTDISTQYTTNNSIIRNMSYEDVEFLWRVFILDIYHCACMHTLCIAFYWCSILFPETENIPSNNQCMQSVRVMFTLLDDIVFNFRPRNFPTSLLPLSPSTKRRCFNASKTRRFFCISIEISSSHGLVFLPCTIVWKQWQKKIERIWNGQITRSISTLYHGGGRGGESTWKRWQKNPKQINKNCKHL